MSTLLFSAPCNNADEASQGEQLHFSDVLISGYVPALADVKTHTGKNRTDDDKLSAEPMDTETVVSPPVRAQSGHTQGTVRAQSGHTHAFLEGLERGHVLCEIIPRGTTPPSRRSLAKPELRNRVQVAEPVSVAGLERPVVVVIGTCDVRKTYPRYVDPWFDVVSRCTSQLIVVGDVELGVETPLGNMTITD